MAVNHFRPSLPPKMHSLARLAGARLDMSPRDYVYLALRCLLEVHGYDLGERGLTEAERGAVEPTCDQRPG